MKNLTAVVVLLAGLFCPASAFARINVVTTTEDLAAIARAVGGEEADVVSISRGYQDPHFVEAKPSHLLKLRKADLFIQVGLELEVAWAPALLTSARNPKILPGHPGFLEASAGCKILQRPSGSVDRSMGDVHPFGNPHFWLDPDNGRIIARSVAARLSELDAAHADTFRSNLAAFEEELAAREKVWDASLSALRGLKVVTYHNSWPNFAERFGVRVVGFIEPKAGVPPSSAHIQELMKMMKSEQVAAILVEPYFDEKLPAKIAAGTGARLIIFPPSVGAEPGIKTYTGLFDRQLELLRGAAEGAGK